MHSRIRFNGSGGCDYRGLGTCKGCPDQMEDGSCAAAKKEQAEKKQKDR